MKTRAISLVAMVVLAAVLALMADDGGVSVSSAKPARSWGKEESIPGGTRVDHVAAAGTDYNGIPRMFVIGDERNDGYDGGQNPQSWEVFEKLPTARRLATETVGANGLIYVIGGRIGFSASDVVEVYDPASNTWLTIAPLNTARTAAAAATDRTGRIFVFGGFNGGGALSSVEVLDPGDPTPTWVTLSQQSWMPVARSHIGAEKGCDNKIYVYNGSRLDAFDPATNTWTEDGVLKVPGDPADGRTLTLGPDGLMYVVFSGNVWGAGRSAWSYDLVDNIWTSEQAPLWGKSGWAAAMFDTQFYVSGGINKFPNTSEVMAFGHLDPANPCWPWPPWTPPPHEVVGGTLGVLEEADTPAEASGSSSARDYTAPVAAAVGGAIVALTAGGWYVRRRWLR